MPTFRSPDPWVTVKGKIIDSQTGKPLGAKIIYERLPDGLESGIAQSNPTTGEYELTLPAGKLYGIRAEAENMMSESQNLDLTAIKEDRTIDRDFDLDPIKVAAIAEESSIALNNVFFDFDKAVLKPESFPELNRLVNMMMERGTMQVEVEGHTDATGPERYNLELSRRRAEAVVRYLSENGVPKNRLSVKFFGENNPIETNETPVGRSRNRRVEFKIDKL
jgi:outer membrane protein OmpA-like peptidoglycan-associated protein